MEYLTNILKTWLEFSGHLQPLITTFQGPHLLYKDKFNTDDQEEENNIATTTDW